MSYWICPFCLERCIKGDRKYGSEGWVHDRDTAPKDENMHGPVYEASTGHRFPDRHPFGTWLPWEV